MVGTSPVLFSLPVSVSVIVRIRDKTVYSSVSVIGKEKIRSSQTRAASTLFYTKISRVSRILAITDTGEEKRTGEVPT